MVSGTDFTESISYFSSSFPNNTSIKWSWPATPATSIYGFLQVAFADYHGTVPQTPVTAKQVKNVSTLVSSHNFTHEGTTNGYDVIYDIFLTDTANDSNGVLFEIEIFLHTPNFAASLVTGSTQIGTFVGSGITWTVAISGNDILFMPSNQADVLADSVDIKAMFAYLIGQGTITGNEFYNGHAFGVEPRLGGGSLTLNSFSVAFS